jgi:DNA ligase (NAD+)
MQSSVEELMQIEGIGEKTAEAIAEFFKDDAHREEIKLLLMHGVRPHCIGKKKIGGHDFEGKIFVLTGTLKNLTRDEATALIKERGGKVAGTVSKKTDYVLVGEDPGSKYSKAKELKIKLLSEEQFRKKVDLQ